MTLDDRVEIPPQVMSRTVADEVVVLDLAAGTYFGLDPVGARIWQLMAEGQTLRDIASQGCRRLTIGQYLPPSGAHLPVERYAPPEEFESWKREARALGFRHVASAALVRSSYRAEELAAASDPD